MKQLFYRYLTFCNKMGRIFLAVLSIIMGVGSISLMVIASIATFRKTGSLFDQDLLVIALICLAVLIWSLLQWKMGMAFLSFADAHNRNCLVGGAVHDLDEISFECAQKQSTKKELPGSRR